MAEMNAISLKLNGPDGYSVLVDKTTADELSKLGIAPRAHKSKDRGKCNVYAAFYRNKRLLFVHRVVCGLKPGDRRTVYFKNGNSLDCRRDNLTFAPQVRKKFLMQVWNEDNRWRVRVRVQGGKWKYGRPSDTREEAKKSGQLVIDKLKESLK